MTTGVKRHEGGFYLSIFATRQHVSMCGMKLSRYSIFNYHTRNSRGFVFGRIKENDHK